MTDIDRAIAAFATANCGLVPRATARELGLTRAMLERRLAAGRLVAVGTRVLKIGGAPPSHRQRVLAACLDTAGVASHRTAAALWGFDGFGRERCVEVTVVKGRRHTASPLAATVQTATRLDPVDLDRIDGIPTTSPARTLLGLAALVPVVDLEDVAGAVDSAIRDGHTADRYLWWRLEQLRCRGRNGVTVLGELLGRRDAGAVTESWLEREVLRVLAAGGIPLPVCQRRIAARGAFVARVDFTYEAARLVIEANGYRTHRTRAQQEADERRRNKLVVTGHRILDFSYDAIVRHPDRVRATVTAALAHHCAA